MSVGWMGQQQQMAEAPFRRQLADQGMFWRFAVAQLRHAAEHEQAPS